MSKDQDSESLAFHRDERRRRRRLAAVIALALLAPLGSLAVIEARASLARRDARLSLAQQAELSALLDRKDTLAQQRVARWNLAAQRDALARLAPGEAACPLTVRPPEQFSAGAYVKYATHDQNFGKWALCILRPGEGADRCTRTHRPSADTTRLRALVAAGEAHTWDLEETRAELEPEEPGVLILADQEVRPVVQPTTEGKASFVPGTLSGRAFLYAPEQGRILCAGRVAVRNSKSVEVEFGHFGENVAQDQAQLEVRAAVDRDLEVVLRFAVPPALRQLP